MTVLRSNKSAISNYFDKLLDGVGHRGSSFTDLDGVTHDGSSGRCLVQEFKKEGEALPDGQRLTLEWLAAQRHFTVWLLVRRNDGSVGFADGRRLDSIAVISEGEYRRRFASWWAGAALPLLVAPVAVEAIAAVPSALPTDGTCDVCRTRAPIAPAKLWLCYRCHPLGTAMRLPSQPPNPT